MNENLAKLLAEVATEKAEYAYPLFPPASPIEIARLVEDARDKLNGYELPRAYLDVLGRTNGLDWNGHELYGSMLLFRDSELGQQEFLRRGVVEVNEQWRTLDTNRRFVFFADNGEQLYCHNLESGNFELVDRITKEMDAPETDAFGTCEELLAALFNHMLNRYGVTAEDE